MVSTTGWCAPIQASPKSADAAPAIRFFALAESTATTLPCCCCCCACACLSAPQSASDEQQWFPTVGRASATATAKSSEASLAAVTSPYRLPPPTMTTSTSCASPPPPPPMPPREQRRSAAASSGRRRPRQDVAAAPPEPQLPLPSLPALPAMPSLRRDGECSGSEGVERPKAGPAEAIWERPSGRALSRSAAAALAAALARQRWCALRCADAVPPPPPAPPPTAAADENCAAARFGPCPEDGGGGQHIDSQAD